MGRDQNTVAKRLREMDKKRKAQDKRARRQKKKDQPAVMEPLPSDSADGETASETPATNATAN